jgi:uracil-DNA glycosylase
MISKKASLLKSLTENIVHCRRCPRLVQWRTQAAEEKVPRYHDWDYWGKPVPGFGNLNAKLLVVGLAPAAHGGNRTGRIFTGDRSGDWLYRVLYRFGFANQPGSVSRDDGLQCYECYVTAAARCAPPQNKLLPDELKNCRPYLVEEIKLLRQIRVIISLGKVGHDVVFGILRDEGFTSVKKKPSFAHGAETKLSNTLTLLASFHPSQQNTFTGKLTEAMFDAVFRRARQLIDKQY